MNKVPIAQPADLGKQTRIVRSALRALMLWLEHWPTMAKRSECTHHAAKHACHQPWLSRDDQIVNHGLIHIGRWWQLERRTSATRCLGLSQWRTMQQIYSRVDDYSRPILLHHPFLKNWRVQSIRQQALPVQQCNGQSPGHLKEVWQSVWVIGWVGGGLTLATFGRDWWWPVARKGERCQFA